MAEFVINGDLSLGHADNWPAQAQYSATGGPGGEPCVVFPAGTLTLTRSFWSSLMPVVAADRIIMGRALLFSMWIKADVPGSHLYVEMRNDDPSLGTFLATLQTANWQDIRGGGAAGNAYVVSDWEVPTEWTLVVASLVVDNPQDFVLGSFYFNHTNGSTREAEISIANLSVRTQDPTLDNNMLSEGGGFERGRDGWAVSFNSAFHSREAARSGEWGYRVVSPTANHYPRSDFFDSGPSKTYYVEYWARRVKTHAPGSVLARIYYQTLTVSGEVAGAFARNEADTAAILRYLHNDPLGEWVRVSGYIRTPDDTVQIRFAPHIAMNDSVVDVDDVYVIDITNGWPTPASGVAEAGVATVDRRGLVSETFARSREKIDLQLAEPDGRLKGGERIELAAFAASSSEVTWRWRQVTGPEVSLVREGNTCYFQAPDVDSPTDMRIAVSASSVDGSNRSDWHFFDLEILPTVGRFAAEGAGGFLPYTPQMVGYNRGKREIWNDVIAPVGMDPEGRKEPKLVDLGIPADDVTFSLDGEEPARASAGAVYVDLRDGAIYRNFGGGYNETDDTTGAPRQNAYMVNPATGEVFEWIEEADDGR